LFADDLRTEPVRGGLQCRDIVNGQEGVIVLAETDFALKQLSLDERMTIEPVGCVKRKKRRHADNDRPEHLIPDIEVVMGKATDLMREDAVVGVLRGILRHADSERVALFHAFEDEVDAESFPLLHAAQYRQNVIFFAHAFAGPLNGNPVVTSISLHPVLVIIGPLTENFLADHRDAEHLPDKVHHLLRPGKSVEVTVDHNTVKAVIYKNEKVAEQPGERIHEDISHRKGEAPVGRRIIKRRPAKTTIAGKDFHLAEEIDYIQGRAADHDACLVTVGPLVLFSTETGDAWLLDPADHLAARLAQDGDPEELYFKETDATFAIGWKGNYQIDGDAFLFIDRNTARVTTILGYPTRRLARLA
jgi:hypothetical protein